MSWHLQYFHVFMALVDKARDGHLTIEEIGEVLNDHYPDHFDDMLKEIHKAKEDGHYSVSEIVKIVSAAVL